MSDTSQIPSEGQRPDPSKPLGEQIIDATSNPEIVIPQVCSEKGCRLERTDEPSYSFIQPIMGQPLGWYDGEEAGEGHFCPKHIAELMAGGNRQTYRYYLPGGEIGQTA